jgi:phosphoethanolamine N-methyltransferase
MTTAQTAPAPAHGQAYDNNGQYSRSGILRYEKIFGHGYISTGGHETTLYLCAKLGVLRPQARVLDVGSGIGGAAIFLAQNYGATVVGVDLSPEMTAIAHERAQESHAPDSVSFFLADVLEMPFDGKFDLIWSRDALMHIPDKPRLFARLFDLLNPGGRLIITDYARGKTPASAAFEQYIDKTGYHVVEPAQYGRLLEGAGFRNVAVEDATSRFVNILGRESRHLVANRAEFLGSFSDSDLNYLVERWAMKERFCASGDMKWGIYLATRPV